MNNIIKFLSADSVAYRSGKGELTILYRPSKTPHEDIRPVSIAYNDHYTEQDTRGIKQ